MSEEVTPQMQFLDLNETQFSLIVALSSALEGLKNQITTPALLENMKALIDSGDFKTVDQAYRWIKLHRDNLTKLQAVTAQANGLLNSVEDRVVEVMLGALPKAQQDKQP